jgi:hypothetical protein
MYRNETRKQLIGYKKDQRDVAPPAGAPGVKERWEEIFRAHESASPAGDETRAALPVEAVADLVGEGLWSLGALYGRAERGPDAAQRAAHLESLAGLISPLESASTEASRYGP